MPYQAVNLSQVQTYPLPNRHSKVALEDFIHPDTPCELLDDPELKEVAQRLIEARQNGRPVLFMMGGHVVKRGLAPIVIALMRAGGVTHLASNGSTTIHDFEIALQGHTSEDVATSLETGRFGMAEETGRMMNQAIRAGARDGLGLGESLGRMIQENDAFQHRELSIVGEAYRLGIPYTVHVALGTDIIHQHPLVDFAAIGAASGLDFRIYTRTVCDLEGGVFCNFGSSVIGPEVFLKALSIARNLGNTVARFTTANFDLVPLANYRQPIQDDQPDYYYRPRKNIVNRPVSLGGKGFHINADHLRTLPTLYHLVKDGLPGVPAAQRLATTANEQPFAEEFPKAAAMLRSLLAQAPELASQNQAITAAFRLLHHAYRTGGKLLLAGNGGSMSDALHISGELNKSFMIRRPMPRALADRLQSAPFGEELARAIQCGLPSIVLGQNTILSTAVENDTPERSMGVAQELYALAKPGDVFLPISTSGNAANLLRAASLAQTLGLPVIALSGETGGELAKIADVTIHAPSRSTPVIQEWHIRLYHTLCVMLEAEFFA